MTMALWCSEAAFRMILCGATAVQIGTGVLLRSPAVFDAVAAELQGIMARKGYTTLEVCMRTRVTLAAGECRGSCWAKDVP